jgi:hypothetical protein
MFIQELSMPADEPSESQRPALVTAGMWLAGIWCVVACAGLVTVLVGGADATLSANDAPVAGEALYRHPGFRIFIGSIAYSGAVSVAIQREHALARLLMFAVWPLSLAAVILVPAPNWDGVNRAADAGAFAALSAIAMWYLFIKSNVTEYFDELSAFNERVNADR